MPRPMTTYRSGIVSHHRTIEAPCLGCGKTQTRSRTFEGVPSVVAEQEAQWRALPVYCIPCWRRAGRPS